MIKRDLVPPPEFIYPVEEWRWVEKSFAPQFLPQAETIFAVANGYLGMRGAFEEGESAYRHGTFVNGFHETWPIPYGERAFGFATTGQTIVNLPHGKIIRLYVDDEPFDLGSYRHEVIKQADVVLAMFLLGHEFSAEQKKRNFDYYDQLTTGDSSLSACIQSIVAFEIGYDELALRYLINALLMDLAEVGGNVKDGCHIASMGGTWMGVVYGLAGLRDYGGRLSFHPHKQVRDLRFHLTVRGQLLAVEIKTDGTTYNLEQGDGLTVYHRDERVDLRPGKPVRRP